MPNIPARCLQQLRLSRTAGRPAPFSNPLASGAYRLQSDPWQSGSHDRRARKHAAADDHGHHAAGGKQDVSSGSQRSPPEQNVLRQRNDGCGRRTYRLWIPAAGPRHQDSIIRMSAIQDFFVARIFLPIARPNDIMPCVPNFNLSRSPEAGIQQNLHEADFDGLLTQFLLSLRPHHLWIG